MIIKTANHRRKTTVKVRTFRILKKKKKKGRNSNQKVKNRALLKRKKTRHTEKTIKRYFMN